MSDLVKLTDFLTLPLAVAVLCFWARFDSTYLPLLICGFLFWTFVEYWLHRAFHSWLFRRAHMRHHQHPRELSEGTLYSLILTALFLALSYRAPILAPAIQGILLGYLAYISIHIANHRVSGANRLLPRLMRNHDAHHRGPPGRHFGVTTEIWDRVFGTF